MKAIVVRRRANAYCICSDTNKKKPGEDLFCGCSYYRGAMFHNHSSSPDVPLHIMPVFNRDRQLTVPSACTKRNWD